MWEFFFLSHGLTITGTFSSPWNPKQKKAQRGEEHIMEKQWREKPYFWEEKKTKGVMEMDTIKTSEGED